MPSNQDVYLLVGVPAAGKSWVKEQAKGLFHNLDHDAYIDSPKGAYIQDIKEIASIGTKPLLIETPFSVSQVRQPLLDAGLTVHTLYIIEEPMILMTRYRERNGSELPKGSLKRQQTYMDRAREEDAFMGDSDQVLAKLLELRKQHD